MMKYLEFLDKLFVGNKSCFQKRHDPVSCAKCEHWDDAKGCEFIRIDFTEIRKLHDLLTAADIPHTFEPLNGGWHLSYFDPDSGDRVCSAITHKFSYGQYLGLVEIMGLLTPEESENDSVVGYLTGNDVFRRIKAHWEEKVEN